MASNSRWNNSNLAHVNSTPPSTSGRKSSSKLSRITAKSTQQNNEDVTNPLGAFASTSKQDVNASSSQTGDSPQSPTNPVHDWFLSQDPSREIFWDYRPLSPLTQSAGNGGGDLMTNLCKTWKNRPQNSSPLGPDSLLKQWTKPQGTPVKGTQRLRPRRAKAAETAKPKDPHEVADRLTKELQRFNEMILQSNSRLKDTEDAQDVSTSCPKAKAKAEAEDIASKQQTPKRQNLVIVKDARALSTGKNKLLDDSVDIFGDKILAPNSCETNSDEDLWGDDADDSFIQKLSQAEFDRAFYEQPTQVIPSTLSSDECDMELAGPPKNVPLHNPEIITLDETNFAPNPKNVSNKDGPDTIVPVTNSGSGNKPKLDHVIKEPVLVVLSDGDEDEFADIFNDDDFCLSQEIISLIDQKTCNGTPVQPTRDPPAAPQPSEPSLSQKRKATAAEIARKREEALKLRQSKMKKSTSFACSNIKKPFLRTFSENPRR